MKGIAIFIASIAILIWGLNAMIGMVIVRYWGEKTTAVVTAVPNECDRYNRIKILLGEAEQEITISRNDCKEGKYRVGQQVELIKHKNFDEPVWPGSHPELAIIIVIGILIFAYLTVSRALNKKDM